MSRRRGSERTDRQQGHTDGIDPAIELRQLVERERERSGPGSAARRALEALADRRRLQRELEDLDER